MNIVAHIISLPKKSGGFRTIVAPNRQSKRHLRGLLVDLNRQAEAVCNKQVVHGFMIGKSPVTNAQAHVGYKWSVCFDLADFFECVTSAKGKAFRNIPDECFYPGPCGRRAAQGLPTSPVVANIVASKLDEKIIEAIKEIDVRYTRYADDLTFSGNDEKLILYLIDLIPVIVKNEGFKINPQKTHVQHSKAGRRIITGVAVDDHGIHPTRACKRKLRAARHQHNRSRARGLEEWMKLKTPSGKPSGTMSQQISAGIWLTKRMGLV